MGISADEVRSTFLVITRRRRPTTRGRDRNRNERGVVSTVRDGSSKGDSTRPHRPWPTSSRMTGVRRVRAAWVTDLQSQRILASNGYSW